ncbi:MAG: lipoprotein NlpI [Candidatus Omnitrophica bacterium ADurb.Bin292]|jgi:tetratricopeptide (TPR) repeat protein|nr:MAG: lipoprotein NlpI [Candidatus Omnitrophica bacterium ADurb.Bin292]
MRTFALVVLFSCLFVPFAFSGISRDDYQRVMNLFEEGQYNESIAILKSSLDQDPNQAVLYNLLGMIYLKQGESIASAIGSFEEAIRIDPDYADAYFNLASTYASSANRPELAADYFKKTLEADPKYVRAYFGLGWFVLTTQEKPEEASEYFKKAVEYFPDFSEAYYGLGLSYIQMGKAPLALESISKVRAMGREDLAYYLETILRGGKVSVPIPEDPLAEVPLADNEALPSQETAPEWGKGTGFPEQVVNREDKISKGMTAQDEISENNNPFQLY